MPTPTPPNNSLKHLQLTINAPIINHDKFADKFRVSTPRMTNWDYSSPGFYFITICTFHMNKFFGKITDGKMELNTKGQIAQKIWETIPNKFNNVQIDKFIVMPNHLHGIINIFRRDAINRVSTNPTHVSTNPKHIPTKSTSVKINIGNNPMSSNNSISAIVRWYKAKTTFEIRHKQHFFFAWQPRFYDHLIRSRQEYFQIKNYVLSNPANWSKDKYYL